MKTNKVRNLVIAAAIIVMSLLSACNDNPCANGSACGLTSPVTDVENAVMDFMVPEREGLLSGGN